MKVLDLFSGIGGFSLGLERAGMETVAFCEFDKKCQLVLKKHWPDVPIYDDVRKLNGRQFEGQSIDLICGGFPCQPFSQAGKRKGEEDDRHLWPEYFRIIQEIRPRWVIGENVSGLISMGLDDVLSDLESENYSCQTLVIPACAINAPHRRDRVWIVGNSERERGQSRVLHKGDIIPTQARGKADTSRSTGERSKALAHSRLFRQAEPDVEDTRRTLQPWTIKQETHENETGQGDANKHQRPGSPPGFDVAYPDSRNRRGLPIGEEKAHPQSSGIGEDVAHTQCIGQQGQGQSFGPSNKEANKVGKAGWFDNGGEGWNKTWDVEPELGRVAHGIPNRVDRLKQLGNAVVPQVVEQIGRAIMKIERE